MSIPANVIAAAVELTTINRKAKELIERANELKELLRGHAIEVRKAFSEDERPSMIEVPTDLGTCSIIFPHDEPKFIKGANPALAKLRLPLEKFNLAFTEEISINKKFWDTWKQEPSAFTKEQRGIISRVITFREATPRVEPSK